MAVMPIQKPGHSKQDYGTPPELLTAIKHRLCITDFDVDVAASRDNAVCPYYYDEERDGLEQPWQVPEPTSGWAWCNPPYNDIRSWVRKAVSESAIGAYIAMLVPLSVSQWWLNYVEPFSYQLFLIPRITFVGCDTPYPKDCAVLLYTPMRLKGNETWRWK